MSTVDVYLHGQRLKLEDADLLGEGGEARVFRHRDLALKVFHPGHATELKARKLAAFPAGLPAEVVAPVGTLTDARGALLGYAMPLVEGAEEFARLSSRRWREGAVPNRQVVGLFTQLSAVLAALHAQAVVMGDLNDGNVLFVGDRPRLIDVDSMQFDALPCPVGHERFLDPRLYGVDLAAAPRFSPGTDWYAFSVMLFQSLLYVHPFGAVHKKLGTLVRRSEARHSVFRPDVVWPRGAVHYQVLPDAALGWFERVFEKDARAQVPLEVLQMDFSRCSCGLEHARAVCPECQALGPVAARQALRSHGRCSARTAFRTAGRVLAAAMQGGLRYVYEEAGRVRREDGSLVLGAAAEPGTRFFISGQSTWVADREGRVLCVKGEQVVERCATGVVGTVPSLTASASVSYRLEQEWVIDQGSSARVGQVLEGQTRVWTGERLGFGVYRAGGLTVGFVLRTGRAGLTRVALSSLVGRLADVDCVFDDRFVLFSAVVEDQGRELGRHWLIDERGMVVAEGECATARGKALLGGRVVCATDQGLVSLKLDSGRLVQGTLFADTQPFIGASDELLPQPDGSLYVVGPKEIVQLSLS